MKLQELLQGIQTASKIPDLEVSALCCDSRQVTPGCLFFALPGTKLDGAVFAAEALRRGASAVISETAVSGQNEGGVVLVQDARLTLSSVAAKFYEEPSKKIYMTAVTGTNGKTTLTYLLEKIWKEESCGVIGTVNIRFNKKTFPASHTTPDAISLQKILSEMVLGKMQRVVMEVSSHALNQKRVEHCHFDSAVFTNLTQDHLDYHQSMDDYFQAKLRLFTEVLPASEKKNKLCVVNLDDEYASRVIGAIKKVGLNLATFSEKHANADLFLKKADFSMQGADAEFLWRGENVSLKTNLIGRHNLKNIMAAALVAEHNGFSKNVLNEFSHVQVPGRLQRILSSNYFVDYAHTPDALENVISALRAVMAEDKIQRRLFVVFGCGGDRDRTKRPLMGKIAARLADVVLVTSDNPRTEDANAIIAEIVPGVREFKSEFDGNSGYLIQVDRRAALEKVTELANQNDVVLVAGKGHEDYQIIGTTKIHFDDVEILAGLLAAINPEGVQY